MNDKPKKTSKIEPTFAGQVGAKATRKLKARRNSTRGVLVWLGHDGAYRLVGGRADAAGCSARSLVGPAPSGSLFLDAGAVAAGLAIGCLNAWHWVAKEDKAMRDEPEDDDE